MRKLSAFCFISLNGFYKGPGEQIDWHSHGDEAYAYSIEQVRAGNILLFGRVTYDLMAAFWPGAMALEQFPEVASGINAAEKIVFSKTLRQAAWAHTRIISEDLPGTIRELKTKGEKDLTLLGSGTILRQLTEEGLVDEFQIMIDPVVLGAGSTLWDMLGQPLSLRLVKNRIFRNGTLLLYYVPA